jgi:PEP-CTERM motif
MKTTLLTILAWTTLGAFGQGTLNVLNNLSGVFRAPIYGWDPASPTTSLSGQSATGLPAGSTFYTGPLLQGTGFTFAVYSGQASVTHPSALTLLVSTTFRTGSAAGLITSILAIPVPGVAPGEQARLQVRAWDNRGGTLPTWEMVTSDPYSDYASSGMFLSGPLGGITSNGELLPADMTGWQSFSIAVIPEPSSLVLIGLAGLAFGGCRWWSRIKG